MANKKEPNRRTDVIRCEKCGEYYSVTYKKCPFCDERPVKPGYRAGQKGGGRRVAGRGGPNNYGGRVNPLQVIGLIGSLILIIAALYIVFNALAPMLKNKDPKPSDKSDASISSSMVDPSKSDQSEVENPPAPPVEPQGPAVTGITLDKKEFSLPVNESWSLHATVTPAEATEKVVWESDKPDVLRVDENGVVTNVNTGTAQVKATITATCGDKTAQCVVYCRGTSSTAKPGAGTGGVVTGADTGLNVRSGPSSTNEAIASLNNGTAVTVLEDTGTGWYKISFVGLGGKATEGYASKDYIKVK